MISVVIPTLNEERALPATLDALFRNRGDFEVVIVDGDSVDGTRRVVEEYARRHRRLRVAQAPPGRALQMNAGAAQTRGDWVLFLHADTLLPENALEGISVLPASVGAGCFRQRFGSDSRLLRVLSWCHNQRFRGTRIIYGDQAMFVRRACFEELGGFPEQPLEDIAFSLRLRAVTRPIMLQSTVVTDARKFDRMGHWRALGRAVGLLVRFRLGAEITGDEFLRDYR